jgi:hypothetical protein
MKTIEERAKAFCENNICVDCGDRKNCDRGCVGCCIPTFSVLEWLIQFGKSEHAELTRWHDPKEELPEYAEVVEVKYKAFGKIMMAVAWRLGCSDSGEDVWYIDGTLKRIDPEAIIGWREIHE